MIARRAFVLLAGVCSPAFASPCLDAGVIEMAAAVGGTGSWQAVVDAHRAALAAGCDDPVIALNIARAQRRIAAEGTEPGPTCAAVDAYRVVLDRGEPRDLIETARARADELVALCAARRARAAALADDAADACPAVAHYDGFDARPPLSLRVDLGAEARPLRARCAQRLHDEARALDARPDRVSACAAYQRYRAHRRMGGGDEASAEQLGAARARCGAVASSPTWRLGPRVSGGMGWHLGKPPPRQTVDPIRRLGGDVIVERRDTISLDAAIGYRTGAVHIDDALAAQSVGWRWHALALGLGARLGLVAGFDLSVGFGAEVLLAADADDDDTQSALDDILEPVVFTGELGAGWTFDPLRVDLTVGLDLGPRAALGDLGGRTGHATLALTYLFALTD